VKNNIKILNKAPRKEKMTSPGRKNPGSSKKGGELIIKKTAHVWRGGERNAARTMNKGSQWSVLRKNGARKVRFTHMGGKAVSERRTGGNQ